MIIYHTTPAAPAILTDGFLDGTGNYLTENVYTGVWFSDWPLDCNEGATGDDVIRVDIPEDLLAPYEWVQEGWGYREWLVPAAIVNKYPRRLLTDEEHEDLNAERFGLDDLPRLVLEGPERG